jgi:hypothetical protein
MGTKSTAVPCRKTIRKIVSKHIGTQADEKHSQYKTSYTAGREGVV